MTTTKPTVNSFSTIAPLIIQEYERYLPTAFNDGMTMLEKVNKIIEFLNTTTDTVNGVVEQWNTVMEWVLNDGLTQEVSDKLDALVSDGTFDTIINQEILGSKASIIVSDVQPTTPDNTTFWFEIV